jgi:hypothetical protein
MAISLVHVSLRFVSPMLGSEGLSKKYMATFHPYVPFECEFAPLLCPSMLSSDELNSMEKREH